MSDPESGDLPFTRDDEEDAKDIPVANPDATAEADEDAENDDDAATDVVLEDPK